MKFLKVYQAKDELDANLIVGYLESYEIKAMVQAVGSIMPMLSGEGRSTVSHLVPRDIYVSEQDLQQATELIKEVRS